MDGGNAVGVSGALPALDSWGFKEQASARVIGEISGLERLLAGIDGARLVRSFHRLCDLGGRFAGSASERAALDHLQRELESIGGGVPSELEVRYEGWTCDGATLSATGGGPFPGVRPLARSPAGAVRAPVVDLGRGTPQDVDRAAGRVRGAIVLVEHEFMFSDAHAHRMAKYARCVEAGASGFVIANPWPDSGAVTGGVVPDRRRPVPAVGVSAAVAERLREAAADGGTLALEVSARRTGEQTTRTLVLDLPTPQPGAVVLSAHVDGHPYSESAIDNATGLACALELARGLAGLGDALPCGVRVMLFSIEEWGLLASKDYVERLVPAERDAILANVNLDSVGGAPELTAMTGGFDGLERCVRAASSASGVPVGVYRPRRANSDHHWFAEAGIPAMRLVAGFDDPESNLRHVLTEADGRALVSERELVDACRLAGAIVLGAGAHRGGAR